MPYLTADEVPGDTICRVLFIPNNRTFIGNVTGALQLLTFASSFVDEGGIDVVAMAAAYEPMFNAFCFNEGMCRVIGEIITYAGTTSPDPNWLLCDGSSLLRVDYPELFDVIGVLYGAADSTHFNIPDLRGRVAVGLGTGSGLSPRSAGDSFGEETHVLTVGELAAHVHDTGNSVLIGTAPPPPFDVLGPNPLPAVTGSTGNDDPHNNMQPSLVINYLIVALNVAP